MANEISSTDLVIWLNQTNVNLIPFLRALFSSNQYTRQGERKNKKLNLSQLLPFWQPIKLGGVGQVALEDAFDQLEGGSVLWLVVPAVHHQVVQHNWTALDNMISNCITPGRACPTRHTKIHAGRNKLIGLT